MKLEIKNINKSFSGKKILNDVTFTINSGKAMGFLGRNGAGKTTTIRIIMDVFKADSGEILIDGKPFNKKNYKIGYLPEEKGMYQKISLIDQLTYFAELKGLNKVEAKKSAKKTIEKIGLSEYENKLLQTLSKGNQQKFFIGQAIVNNPDILILDEPFGGLDPVNAQVLKDIIKEYITEKKLVVFSSHQMSHVEEFCDDVTFIKNGNIIISENLTVLKRNLGKNKYKLIIADKNNKEVKSILDEIKNIRYEMEKEYFVIECLNDKSSKTLLNDLLKNDIEIDLFGHYEPSLEKIFIKLEGDN